jgi:hypothetical protein
MNMAARLDFQADQSIRESWQFHVRTGTDISRREIIQIKAMQNNFEPILKILNLKKDIYSKPLPSSRAATRDDHFN